MVYFYCCLVFSLICLPFAVVIFASPFARSSSFFSTKMHEFARPLCFRLELACLCSLRVVRCVLSSVLTQLAWFSLDHFLKYLIERRKLFFKIVIGLQIGFIYWGFFAHSTVWRGLSDYLLLVFLIMYANCIYTHLCWLKYVNEF